MTKTKALQDAIRLYRLHTGKAEVDLKDVATYAVKHLGMELPKPIDPIDKLAKDLAKAAREETRTDKKTGRPYRANHAVPIDGSQQCLWVDIDQASRSQMRKSIVHRRNLIIGDNLQLSLDIDHWNANNPAEEPINIPLDYTEDVEERKSLMKKTDTTEE